MGRLAEAAGASGGLTGPVTLTDPKGRTTTYEDEKKAEAAIPADHSVEWRRGGFFIKAPDPGAAPTTRSKKKAKKRSSSDEGEE